MPTAFENFVTAELPLRPVMLTVDNTGYSGNPNLSADAAINGAPKGTYFINDEDSTLFIKLEQAVSTSWSEVSLEAPNGTLVHVYISQANGDDNNTGLTSGDPIATLQSFIDRYPLPPLRGFIFHFDSGNHTAFTLPQGWGLYESIVLSGDGAGQGGDTGMTELRVAEASQGGSTEAIIATTGSLSTAWIGAMVEVTSGTGINARRQINRVDGSDLYLDFPVTGFVTGDTFRVLETAIKIELPTGEGVVLAQGIGSLGNNNFAFGPLPSIPSLVMLNVGFTDAGGTFQTEVIRGCNIVSYGFDLSSVAILDLTLDACAVYSAPSSATFTEDAFITIASVISQVDASYPQTSTQLIDRWTGWGTRAGTSFVFGCKLIGYWCSVGGKLTLADSSATLAGGSGSVTLSLNSTLEIAAGTGASWYATGIDSGPIISCADNCYVLLGQNIGTIHLEPTDGLALNVAANSSALITGATLISPDTFAVSAREGSHVSIRGSSNTITGSDPGVNDLTVDGVVGYGLSVLDNGNPLDNGDGLFILDGDVLAPVSPPNGTLTHIYVSVANGDDANDGFTTATPIATLQSFIDRYTLAPPERGFIFHFDSGTHTSFRFPMGWGQYESIVLAGDGAGQGGDDGLTELRAAEAAQALSTEEVIVTTGGLVSTWLGATLEVTSGAAINARRSINRIDGDDLYVVRALTGFLVGDTFRIIETAANIDLPTGEAITMAQGMGAHSNPISFVTLPSTPSLMLVNMGFIDSGGTLQSDMFRDCQLLAFGMDLNEVSLFDLSLDACTTFSAPEAEAALENSWQEVVDVLSQVDAAYPQTTTQLADRWSGWGLRCTGLNVNGGNFAGYLCNADATTSAAVFSGGNTYMQGGCGNITARNQSFLDLSPPVGSSFYAFTAPSFGTLSATDGAYFRVGSQGTVEVASTSGAGIIVFREGTLFISGANSTISSTAGPGIRATIGRVIIQGSALAVTGSSAGVNDLEVGEGSNVVQAAFASISASGDFITNGGYSVITRE